MVILRFSMSYVDFFHSQFQLSTVLPYFFLLPALISKERHPERLSFTSTGHVIKSYKRKPTLHAQKHLHYPYNVNIREPHLIQNIKNDFHINKLNSWAKAKNLV